MKVVPPTQESLRSAAELLKQGDLVAFPTETVYGLGANAENEEAVRKVFLAKGRPSNNPLIVHIPSLESLARVSEIDSPLVERRVFRISGLWPGPLSVVLPRAASLAPSVSGSTAQTVAVRIPMHPVALALLNACGLPLAAPSANISGYISPTTASHVDASLNEHLSMIIDGGPCSVGLESTVISLVGEAPLLLRPGSISRENVEDMLGERVLEFRASLSLDAPLLSPGLLLKHYSPKTRTVFAKDACHVEGKSIGVLWFSDEEPPFDCKKLVRLSSNRRPEEIAPKLYAALRELNASGLDIIVLDEVESSGLGLAIMDRLRRATEQLDLM